MNSQHAVHWTARAGPFSGYFQNQPFIFLTSLVEALAATDRRRWPLEKTGAIEHRNQDQSERSRSVPPNGREAVEQS